jgi:hypothetical protein
MGGGVRPARSNHPIFGTVNHPECCKLDGRYTAEMKKIDLEKYPRRALLEAFKNRDVPVFSVTGAIDITHFKMFVDRGGYGFSCP